MYSTGPSCFDEQEAMYIWRYKLSYHQHAGSYGSARFSHCCHFLPWLCLVWLYYQLFPTDPGNLSFSPITTVQSMKCTNNRMHEDLWCRIRLFAHLVIISMGALLIEYKKLVKYITSCICLGLSTFSWFLRNIYCVFSAYLCIFRWFWEYLPFILLS